jgi:hypothetical protein
MGNNSIYNVNNIQVGTINGGSITTIGLLWGDFTNTNAYANLPNQSYALQNSNIQTSHFYDRIQIDNANVPNQMILNSSGLSFTDNTSSTTTFYGSNNLYSQNGTAYTIDIGTGGAGLQPLNINCSALVINGTTWTPPPPNFNIITNQTGISWSIGSGGWNNIWNSGITFPTGWSGIKEFQLGIAFNDITTSETTGVFYIQFQDTNSNISVPLTYNSTTPCLANAGSSFTGSYTQFNFVDRIQLNNTSGASSFTFNMYLGHNGGSWSGTGQYSLTLIPM